MAFKLIFPLTGPITMKYYSFHHSDTSVGSFFAQKNSLSRRWQRIVDQNHLNFCFHLKRIIVQWRHAYDIFIRLDIQYYHWGNAPSIWFDFEQVQQSVYTEARHMNTNFEIQSRKTNIKSTVLIVIGNSNSYNPIFVLNYLIKLCTFSFFTCRTCIRFKMTLNFKDKRVKTVFTCFHFVILSMCELTSVW